jgi:hypothetical protein
VLQSCVDQAARAAVEEEEEPQEEEEEGALEELSQQLEALTSPPKPKKTRDGSSKEQALEINESQE